MQAAIPFMDKNRQNIKRGEDIGRIIQLLY
jgi:hypothetical protein